MEDEREQVSQKSSEKEEVSSQFIPESNFVWTNESYPILPRGWQYDDRWKESFEIDFRRKHFKIKQSAVGSRVGATVWDIVDNSEFLN